MNWGKVQVHTSESIFISSPFLRKDEMSEFMGCLMFYNCVTYKVSSGVKKGKPLQSCNSTFAALLGFLRRKPEICGVPDVPPHTHTDPWRCTSL